MKVLVIGGGGREHALTWSLAKSPLVDRIIASPGNPGMAHHAVCLAPPSPTAEGFLAVARSVQPDLTVVGPEAPLVDGIVDLFRSAGFRILGPTQAAARLEGSKIFAKQFLARYDIPTARFQTASDLNQGLSALADFDYPVVLKADGLAAGKGVVICESRAEARRTLETMLSGRLVGAAGRQVVLEEFLTGEEVSFIALSDGNAILPLEASQDHKRLLDEDQGPNTGGMGAYSDSRLLTDRERGLIMDRILRPTIDGMRSEGMPFLGFLYAGLMLTADGPKVLEFNVRLGDPEAQALLPRLDCDLAAALEAATQGRLADARLNWRPDPSVCVVAAAHGYPGHPRLGDPIAGIEQAEAEGAAVFHAGTRRHEGGLVTAGGRVLGVTASGPTLPAAIGNVYRALSRISFAGMQYRRDIGAKGSRRW